MNTPDFIIIGAQKSGTTWLWDMLDQHPDTSLPSEKEIHYFGSSELYSKGFDWYLSYFNGLDPGKIIGEASTSYFYDRAPYWYNNSDQIEFDDALPLLPDLISQRLPDVKFIVILRDPVYRAISAYFHWMMQGKLSPSLGLKKVATEQPKRRILEYGLYAKWLRVWSESVTSDRLRIFFYEEHIKKNPEKTLTDIYEYLCLDPGFRPESPDKHVNRSWGWTRIAFNYYASKLSGNPGKSKIGALLDRFDIFSYKAIKAQDIEFLRSVYLPEKNELQTLTGNQLTYWDYGDKMLRKLRSI
jgi:hypothetical protein